MTEMPTISHVPTLLATLSPGVVAQDQNNNIVRPWSYIGASQVTADGGRNNIYSNNFQLDGMPNTKAGGYVAFIPPMDSMKEFRVQTNAYDASIGRQAGATMNMQTKSGTKDYHGTLYWFNQNNILNAKLFQTNLVNGSKPPVHFNEPGGTFWPRVCLRNKKTEDVFLRLYDRTHTIDPVPARRTVPTKPAPSVSRQSPPTPRFLMRLDPPTVDSIGNRSAREADPHRASVPSPKTYSKHSTPNTAGDPTSNASKNFAFSVANNTIPML